MKEQGSALRIVAFAVAIAIVLGLSSVMFQLTASAESASSESDISTSTDYDKDISVGTLKNYTCLQLGYNSEIDYLHLRNLYYASNSPYMFYALFGVDSSDNLVALTSNIGSKYTSNNYTGYQYANIPDTYYLGKLYKFKLGFSVSPADSSFFCFNMYKSNFDSDIFNTYVTYATFDKSLYSKFYLVYTGSSDVSSSALSSFVSDVSNNINGSDFKDSSDTSSIAKFITCASFTNPDGSFPLWVKDFIAEGHQYPMFTFAISDNGNNHKYSMVLSYNDNDLIAPFIVGMYDDLSDSDKRTGFKLTTAISKKFHVPGFVGITNMSDVLKKGCINIFEKNWVNLTYNRAFNLNSSDMDFTDNTGNKVYTITLSDYSAIKANTFYKAELIDLTTSEVLDVTYFTSAQSFNKSDSGNGTKIYNYGDKSDQMWDDLKNNTPSVDPSKGDNFNVDGDVDTNFDNLSNLNINDIISGLRTSISSVSVFFQACWSLFPAAFWSIILLGVSLIIILRILGR